MQFDLPGRQCKGKDGSGWMIIGDGDAAPMGSDNGFAQAQAKAKTSAAVGDLVGAAVEHLEHPLLLFVGNARAVVPDGYQHLAVLLFRVNFNGRPGGGVLDGVVHQVDDDLDNESGIHIGQDEIFIAGDGYGMLPALAVDVLESFGDNLVHQLHGPVQMHLTALNAGDSQQIFHQIDQPHGVVIDICKGLLPQVVVHLPVVCQKISGAAGDGGQGCAQVVGDGAQQIGPELLVLGKNRGGLLLPGVADVFNGQGAFAQNGQQNAVFEGVQTGTIHGNAHHAADVAVHPDGKIQPVGPGQGVRGGSGVLVVAQHPLRHGPLTLGHQIGAVPVLGSEDGGLGQRFAVGQVDDQILVQKLSDLTRCGIDDCGLLRLLLQQLVGFKQNLGAVGCVGGLSGILLQPVGQRPGQQRHHEHDGKGDEVIRIVKVEGKPWGGEEKVEHQHADD